MIFTVLMIVAAICFLLAAIGRPAWPWLPIGLMIVAIAFAIGGGGLDISISGD
jgi:hypothetical protein